MPAGYELRCTAYRKRVAAATRRAAALANARLATFLLTAATVWIAAGTTGSARVLLAWLAAAGGLAFVILARAHAAARSRRWMCHQLLLVNEEGLSRLAQRWRDLPTGTPHRDATHPYAAELSLVGDASLWQLLGGVSEAPGAGVLRSWLLAPAAASDVRERQAGVAELAAEVSLRDSLAIHARGAHVQPAALERFLSWMDADGQPALTFPMVWVARALALSTVVLGVWWMRDISTPPLWIVPVVLNVAVLARVGTRARDTFDRSAAPAASLGHYASAFDLIRESRFDAPILRRHREALETGGTHAGHQARALQRIVGFAEVRYSPMMHLPLNALFLYDVHVLDALQRWHRRARLHGRRWFAALGELEALAALATLAHDNPDWAYPELADGGEGVLVARALAHPLLPRATRVANDVRIGPPGTFLLVTGSNMSGKSTLLRAIGVNVVLAQAGGPVCASAMRLPAVDLRTAMRAEDSLEQGVSLFMAELLRLRDVVLASRRAAAAGGRPVLYLLDEVLHGTNTAERQVAARRILGHLIAQRAIGAISTHDLALADTSELAAVRDVVHFTERMHESPEGPAMSFDYRLRPGIATSVNALKLLELVGL